ncbi:MAG: 4Fe-4S cluster-binding domain-containing protein [archaeon]|nr:4Fe-4S cluster-binding domain-containing protein [archaeon]
MPFQRFDSGSAANGELAKGCEYCIKGSKMVLLVTGRCKAGCFYCPISAEKKGKDVIYANEGRVTTDEEVINEALSMEAEGTGITGGDPSENMERTIHFIRLLKERFGKEHHIHMYTAVIDLDNAIELEKAGLDEIRYHPIESLWTCMEKTQLAEIVKTVKMDVGVEVPALPGKEEETYALAKYAFEVGVKFMNLNELEFSESNWDMMKTHNFLVKDELSSAVLGAEDVAINVMFRLKDYPIHFCSSTFKDSVQLRNRLIRRAEHIAKEYDVITEDGTIIKGLIYHKNLDEAMDLLRNEYEVPDELMFKDEDRKRLEIASWILEEIGAELPYKCYIVEEYPTEDRLEVERTPISKY